MKMQKISRSAVALAFAAAMALGACSTDDDPNGSVPGDTTGPDVETTTSTLPLDTTTTTAAG
jgi:hypothetical protein